MEEENKEQPMEEAPVEETQEVPSEASPEETPVEDVQEGSSDAPSEEASSPVEETDAEAPAAEGEKMEGTVKWFNTQKGFGFIKGEDGKDYFVHHSQVPEGMNLNENDRVSFEAVQTDKGMQAQNIALL